MDVDKYQEGRTALFHASLEGKDDIVQILLDAGADISICSTKDGDTPLIIACSEGHSKVAQKLILAGAQVNGPNRGGWTPLIYAAYYDHKEVVQLLLSHNADINQTSNVSNFVFKIVCLRCVLLTCLLLYCRLDAVPYTGPAPPISPPWLGC